MKRTLFVIAIIAAALCISVPADARNPKSVRKMKVTALSFLKMGVGARANAMGNAFGALVDDASAVYWNPASIAKLTRPEFFVMHNEYILDTRMEYGAMVYPYNKHHTFGIGVTYLGIDDIPVTTLTSPTGTGDNASARDLAVTLSYATTFTPYGISLGLSVKYFREELYRVTAGGLLVDVALNLPQYIKNLDISLVGQNLGAGRSNFDVDKFDAPNNFKLGFAYRIPHPLVEDKLLFTYDFNTVDQFTSNAGVEYNYKKFVFLRAGWDQAVDVGTGATFGAGVKYKDFNFDYAYVPMGEFGSTHRVSLGYRINNYRPTEDDDF